MNIDQVIRERQEEVALNNTIIRLLNRCRTAVCKNQVSVFACSTNRTITFQCKNEESAHRVAFALHMSVNLEYQGLCHNKAGSVNRFGISITFIVEGVRTVKLSELSHSVRKTGRVHGDPYSYEHRLMLGDRKVVSIKNCDKDRANNIEALWNRLLLQSKGKEGWHFVNDSVLTEHERDH